MLKQAHIPHILAKLQTVADPDLVPNPAYHFDANPDPDFYMMLIRIWIFFGADPGYQKDADTDEDLDPQHWSTVFASVQHIAQKNMDTQVIDCDKKYLQMPAAMSLIVVFT